MFLTYDGISFENLINIVDINLGILPERTNHSYTIGNQHGAKYDGFKYEPKVIEVDFNVISDRPNDFKQVRRELAKVLNVNEPKKLIFSHEPEVYWLAVPDGAQDLQETLRLGEGTLTFLALEPYAMSLNEKVYTLPEGKDTITINNEGLLDTPIEVDVEFNQSDSGVFTIVGDDQVFSYGSSEQVDTIKTKRTERLFYDGMDNLSNGWYSDDSIKVWGIKQPDVHTGSFRTDKYGMYLASQGTYTANDVGWGGKVMVKDIPTDSANSDNHLMWKLEGNVQMEDPKASRATGLMYVAVLDEDNIPISYIKWWDSSANYNSIRTNLHYVERYEDGTTKDILMRSEDNINYKGTFSMVQENKGRGWNMYTRVYNGASKHVLYNNKRYFFKGIPRKATKIAIFMGNNISDSAGHNFAYMGFTMMAFRKYYPDVPDGVVRTVNADNYFMKQDQATFNMTTGETLINNLPEVDGRRYDSDLITLPPGQSVLGFQWSNWAKQPSVKVRFRERHLN